MTVQATGAPAVAYRPRPLHAGDDRFVDLAAELARGCAVRAAEHDRENTFVHEGFAAFRETGYTRLPVPEELGGLGASLRQVCYAQAELAKGCGSAALAVNMHLYLTLVQGFRYRRNMPGAEAVLRRVASEGIILMTSGANDGIWPTGKAVRENGGFRVSGRKAFCSQAPVGDVFVTATVYDDPQEGSVVLMVSIPTKAEGFRIVETWDTLGMRATASHDVQLDNVLVGEAQVIARRPLGRLDPVLRTAAVHFHPIVSAVYYGVAAGARDEAVRVVSERKRGDGQPLAEDPGIQRIVGQMDQKLRTSWWALMGALDELGDDYTPDDPTVDTVQTAKRAVVSEAQEIVDLAMEAVGGAAYFKRSPLERAYRDVRGGKFHPFSTEKSLAFTGRRTLGLPVDTIW